MDIVEREYQNDNKLKREDVKLLQEWLEGQPHLPKMTEQEIIWFLKSCYFSNEATKITIDNYFTMKTLCPDLLRNRDLKTLLKRMDVITFLILPQKTPDGDSILLTHVLDPNPENFFFNDKIRLLDMVTMVDLYRNGTQEGFRCCFDMKDISFGHLGRIGIMSLKRFLYYLQEGMPVRLKGLHFFNVTSVMDKLLILIKPFLKKEVLVMLHLHNTAEDMKEFVPIECLPSDYGGKQKSIAQLSAETKEILKENSPFFTQQESQLVDENKRPGKPKNATDIFGVEGTFKKLDLD